MKTEMIVADERYALEKAAGYLKAGQVVAFPTESVYGLGANCFDTEAVAKIFSAKGRPQDNPLIIHVSSIEMLLSIQKDIPKVYSELIKKYWPGPLTILCKKPSCIPDIVTAGQDTIAVRMPGSLIARKLIDLCGFPLAAPSANISGRPSPTMALHVYNDLNTKIPLILDGGNCESGVESTVLDGLRPIPAILRPGGVTAEQIREVIGNVQVYNKDFTDFNLELAPSTPGMKYRHYCPRVPIILVEGNQDRQIEKIHELIEDKSFDRRIGVLLASDELLPGLGVQMLMGSSPKKVAQMLFIRMLEMEQENVDCIIIQGISELNEGMAVMNRLRKAASRIIKV